MKTEKQPDKLNFEDLGKEAEESVVWMVTFCIQNGYCMGMDEGLTKDGKKRAFRKQLEAFSITGTQ